MSSRMIIVGTVEISIPFVVALTVELVSLLVTIICLVMSVSVVDDVPTIPLTLATLIQC
jgi:hypothetical protein